MTKVEKKKARAAKILDKYGDPALDRLTRHVINETGVKDLSLAYIDYVTNKHREDLDRKSSLVCWIITAVFLGLSVWKIAFIAPMIIFIINATYSELSSRMCHMQAEHSKHTITIAALGIVKRAEEDEE